MSIKDHKPEPFFENADSCPHQMPDRDADPATWDAWDDVHHTYADGWLCRDLPVGQGCQACTDEDGDMVMWPCPTAVILKEAADLIRNSPELRDLTDDHMSDCYSAADLIDPEL